jgi:hypothetical protein
VTTLEGCGRPRAVSPLQQELNAHRKIRNAERFVAQRQKMTPQKMKPKKFRAARVTARFPLGGKKKRREKKITD